MKSGKERYFFVEDEWNDSRLIIQSAIVRKSWVPSQNISSTSFGL